jgi:RNA polymerase sigma factor (sigma-70 family)
MANIIYFTRSCDFVRVFERFYFEWNRRFFRHVLKNIPNFDYDLARDICQQVWTEVWQAIITGTYTYLTPGLLVYKAHSRIRDHHRKTARFAQFDPTKHDRVGKLNLDARIDHKTALATLSADERTIFKLYFHEGFSQEEIGARLAVSSRTVRRQLDAALTHLKEFLRCQAVTPKIIETLNDTGDTK